MNPTGDPPPPQAQPAQPPRSSFTCDRHPEENFTGFCPSCLCERLTTLDQSSAAAASSSSRRPSTSSSSAAAALKSLFKAPISTASNNKTKPSPSSFLPELRRTKSFSASNNHTFSGAFEPQRKSCDVRARSNTLWSLFTIDDESKSSLNHIPTTQKAAISVKEEDEDENDDVQNDQNEDEQNEDEIRVLEEQNVENAINEDYDAAMKTMKDHIDLDSQAKKVTGRDFKEIAGTFWSAASVFSKKLQKWRRKQKLKKRSENGGDYLAALPVEKPINRQFRETQSEIADYGFGRRSCDTDPRFSLDACRISFDENRYSFDEPRASWDGYLIGKSLPKLPPMVSVVEVEDTPPDVVHVSRADTLMPVEDETVPGGWPQTKEYYSDSSTKRRKSLDRSSSIRKTAAAVVAEVDEMKVAVSNAKVTPASNDYFQGAKLDKDLRDSNSNSLRDDCSETFELGFRDSASVIGGGSNGNGNVGERKGAKKSRRWSWNIWGFIHRRNGGTKDEDEERYRGNGVERSLSESWQERGGLNRRVFRSNSSVSWRNSYNVGGSFGSARKSNVEMNGNGRKFVLERNRSARYSPNHVDNGLLRFYLTPLRSSRRAGSGKNRSNSSHSIARTVLRLY
ncbi:hypothetical protein RJ639_036078 [Escallonia herrerae]|uniref:Uncharacterized protein n=1 Tax=Escallonia herrerae TaxID=1293975 RepID=A0AA88X304_9ASTE|nr:hypothetical protein RJ639_036078 [Escallonia herrerae]